MKVLVIVEDPIYDQEIIKPLLETLFAHLKRPARIRVHQERLQGYGEALKAERIEQIVAENRHSVDLFILCIDRDCEYPGHPRKSRNREEVLTNIENHIAQAFPGEQLFAQAAWEELETWLLAGLDWEKHFPDWRWTQIREDCDPKDNHFVPLIRALGFDRFPDEGRRELMRQVARSYKKLSQRCREDFGRLEARIAGMGAG